VPVEQVPTGLQSLNGTRTEGLVILPGAIRHRRYGGTGRPREEPITIRPETGRHQKKDDDGCGWQLLHTSQAPAPGATEMLLPRYPTITFGAQFQLDEDFRMVLRPTQARKEEVRLKEARPWAWD